MYKYTKVFESIKKYAFLQYVKVIIVSILGQEAHYFKLQR